MRSNAGSVFRGATERKNASGGRTRRGERRGDRIDRGEGREGRAVDGRGVVPVRVERTMRCAAQGEPNSLDPLRSHRPSLPLFLDQSASFAGITQIRFEGYFSPSASLDWPQDPCALLRRQYTNVCVAASRMPYLRAPGHDDDLP